MIKLAGSCVALAFACGCGQPAGESAADVDAHAVARVSETPDVISIVFTAEENRPHLDEALRNEVTDFAWVKFDIDAAYEDALHSADGLSVDLTKSDNIWFTQVYRGSCDPSDFDRTETCWLFERYQAGQEALEGFAHLRLTADDAEANYEVYWEGVTDRFDGPPQWNGHQSVGGYAAKIDQ
ncbi:MAG TPA: hypothetical protein VFG83_11005 [Kofleriaceae bacterium]|nr:hypothetical protein [Kofleriaceae bacterium]